MANVKQNYEPIYLYTITGLIKGNKNKTTVPSFTALNNRMALAYVKRTYPYLRNLKILSKKFYKQNPTHYMLVDDKYNIIKRGSESDLEREAKAKNKGLRKPKYHVMSRQHGKAENGRFTPNVRAQLLMLIRKLENDPNGSLPAFRLSAAEKMLVNKNKSYFTIVNTGNGQRVYLSKKGNKEIDKKHNPSGMNLFLERKGYGKKWYLSNVPIKRRDELGQTRIKYSTYKLLEAEYNKTPEGIAEKKNAI